MTRSIIMENKEHHHDEDNELELYGEPGIASLNAPVPKWLIGVNAFCVVIGLLGFYFFWNGSEGWLDRGYWNELQRAANTTFPFTTTQIVEQEAAAAEKQKASQDK